MNRLSRRFHAMRPPTYDEARASEGYQPGYRDTLSKTLHEAIDTFERQCGSDTRDLGDTAETNFHDFS